MLIPSVGQLKDIGWSVGLQQRRRDPVAHALRAFGGCDPRVLSLDWGSG